MKGRLYRSRPGPRARPCLAPASLPEWRSDEAQSRQKVALRKSGAAAEMEQAPKQEQGHAQEQEQEIVLLVNYFITTTVSLVNKFALCCEDKLTAIAQRTSSVEAQLTLLEAKLDSIPGAAGTVEDIVPRVPIPADGGSVGGGDLGGGEGDASDNDDGGDDGGDGDVETAPPPPGKCQAQEHPDYQGFFKLKRLGVPDPQIRFKLSLAGLTPDLIETPEALVDLQGGTPADPAAES